MTIRIDVDAHFEPGDDWLIPYPELAARLPPKPDMTRVAAQAFVGELLRHAPEEQRPSWDDLIPPGVKLMFGREKSDEAERRAALGDNTQFPVANAQARLQWMDAQGIDLQHVICLSGSGSAKAASDLALRQDLVRACNDWLADTCRESGGRLLPVTNLDYSDLDFAVRELTRMRGRGSRMFLIPGRPIDGVSPIHPAWDRLWSAATDLGMTAMYHIGNTSPLFEDGWWNHGGDTTLLRQIGSTHKNVPAMNLIYSMVYGGVFERHPNLTLITAEVGVGWLPFLYWEIDHVLSDFSDMMLGKWSLPMRPSEYLARNVRATPLAGVVCGGDQEVAKIMELVPDDLLVFSSDFPHFEGIHDPAAYFGDKLRSVPAHRRDRFYGGSIAEVYARMGDPIC